MKKISITGTKGKTTTVNVVASVLETLGCNTLKVDTTGHFVNGVRKSTLDDSKEAWSLVPSVCPGRYLWEFYAHPELQENGAAVLECSLGCSGPSGLGYRYHDVGVFLNVFEDHLGSSDRLNNREDIAKAKSFVFKRIAQDGYAVFNADDELVVNTLSEVPQKFNVTLLPCGFDFTHFDLPSHLQQGGVALTCEDSQIILRSKEGDTVLADLKQIPWTFNGAFQPSVWNIMQAAGALYAYFAGELPANFRTALEAVRLDKYGGRLTLLKAQSGATILADYAHEKQSLVEVGKLARTLTGPQGKVIGVVRLAHDRTDDLMQETGRTIAPAFDSFVVYEKIDGHWRKPVAKKGIRFPQIIGRTSEVFATAIAEVNPHTERILREDLAIKRAAELAGPEDVVVIIVNDDIERSIGFIQNSFQAEFL